MHIEGLIVRMHLLNGNQTELVAIKQLLTE